MTIGRALVLCAAAAAWPLTGSPGEGPAQGAQVKAGVTKEAFGRTAEGTAVDRFTMTNAHGVQVAAMTFGGIITSVRVPDRTGAFADVVLGFDALQPYLPRPAAPDGRRTGHPFFGSIVGRYGNRIGNARFTLDGRTYTLAANNGPNHLHGGVRGFDKHVWNAEADAERRRVTFSRRSPDGEEGYPGNLDVRVVYTLTDANELAIEYEAVTDRPTPVNLTQHSYFNLGGHASGDILAHEVTIHADRYTPVDDTLIPTGELAPVDGTPFDFRTPTRVGARIDTPHPGLKAAGGYDHNYVLNGRGFKPAARVVERKTGRTLDVATTEPGMQFYTGNFLDGSQIGKEQAVYRYRTGLCLETQHFPDSPNKPQFPSTILRPGETYRSRTVFTFGVLP